MTCCHGSYFIGERHYGEIKMGKSEIAVIEQKAKIIRRDAVEMIRAAGGGWLGGSFSQADILATLMFHHMKHDLHSFIFCAQ